MQETRELVGIPPKSSRTNQSSFVHEPIGHSVRDMGNSASVRKPEFDYFQDPLHVFDSDVGQRRCHYSMDYDNSALFGNHQILGSNFNSDNLEGIPSEFSTEQSAAADLQYAPEDNLDGIPSEFSYGHDSNAPTEPSLIEDLLSTSDDDSEGNPSESSIGHDSNAPTEPSHDDDFLPATDDDFEGIPSESSIGHDSDAPTEPDDDPADSTCSSTASGSHARHAAVSPSPAARPPRPSAHFHPMLQPRRRYNYGSPAAYSSSAAHAAVLTTPKNVSTQSNHPAGIPNGSVHNSLPPGSEQEGTPSCSEPRPPASSTSSTAEAGPTNDFEQQLTRILCRLAELKRDDAMIHVAAADSSSQLEQLKPLALAIEMRWIDAYELRDKAVATEDAWLTHLATLAESDRNAWATARQHYDRFCTEYGLHANLERAKELVEMLWKVVKRSDTEFHKLRDQMRCDSRSPMRHQKNGAFTICEKMPPVKLYELPGIPGNPKLPGGRSDKDVHGNPCTPQSRPKPKPDSGIASAGCEERQHPAAPSSSQNDKPARPAPVRPYCVFCRCHDHWSSDCPSHDFDARWKLTLQRQLCRQCLHAGHPPTACRFANRHCKHCAAHHHAALCPKPHPRFLPSSDISPNPVPGHPSVAIAAGGRSPPDPATTAHSVDAQRKHDDRQTTTNPLDTKPPSSFSTKPSAAAAVEAPEHSLAKAITSFFQRNSAGTDVDIGFYARWQDNAGRTFYRILKPLPPSFQLPSAANNLYAHLQVDRVIMIETTAHVLPCDPLLSSHATPDTDSRQSTRRFTHPSAGSSCVYPTTQGVAATDLSGVAPRQATILPDLATALRTSPLPRPDALRPTTTDSAPSEVEPEDQGTARRSYRRKRGLRRKQSDHARSTSSTQSTPILTTGFPADLIDTSGHSDAVPSIPASKTPSSTTSDADATTAPVQRSFAARGPSTLREMTPADPEASGIPSVFSGCDKANNIPSLPPSMPIPPPSQRQLPLKRIRTWTASNRKKTPPELFTPTTITTTPHTTEAHEHPTQNRRTAASRSHASGNCREQLLECANTFVRAPHSSSTTPIRVLYDSSVRHNTCSTKLALDLQLPLSSTRTGFNGSASCLPDMTTTVSVSNQYEGGSEVTIPLILVPTLVRANGLQTATRSIQPHIVIGRDFQHLIREIVHDRTALELDAVPPRSTSAVDASLREGDIATGGAATGNCPPHLFECVQAERNPLEFQMGPFQPTPEDAHPDVFIGWGHHLLFRKRIPVPPLPSDPHLAHSAPGPTAHHPTTPSSTTRPTTADQPADREDDAHWLTWKAQGASCDAEQSRNTGNDTVLCASIFETEYQSDPDGIPFASEDTHGDNQRLHLAAPQASSLGIPFGLTSGRFCPGSSTYAVYQRARMQKLILGQAPYIQQSSRIPQLLHQLLSPTIAAIPPPLDAIDHSPTRRAYIHAVPLLGFPESRLAFSLLCDPRSSTLGLPKAGPVMAHARTPGLVVWTSPHARIAMDPFTKSGTFSTDAAASIDLHTLSVTYVACTTAARTPTDLRHRSTLTANVISIPLLSSQARRNLPVFNRLHSVAAQTSRHRNSSPSPLGSLVYVLRLESGGIPPGLPPATDISCYFPPHPGPCLALFDLLHALNNFHLEQLYACIRWPITQEGGIPPAALAFVSSSTTLHICCRTPLDFRERLANIGTLPAPTPFTLEPLYASRHLPVTESRGIPLAVAVWTYVDTMTISDHHAHLQGPASMLILGIPRFNSENQPANGLALTTGDVDASPSILAFSVSPAGGPTDYISVTERTTNLTPPEPSGSTAATGNPLHVLPPEAEFRQTRQPNPLEHHYQHVSRHHAVSTNTLIYCTWFGNCRSLYKLLAAALRAILRDLRLQANPLHGRTWRSEPTRRFESNRYTHAPYAREGRHSIITTAARPIHHSPDAGSRKKVTGLPPSGIPLDRGKGQLTLNTQPHADRFPIVRDDDFVPSIDSFSSFAEYETMAHLDGTYIVGSENEDADNNYGSSHFANRLASVYLGNSRMSTGASHRQVSIARFRQELLPPQPLATTSAAATATAAAPIVNNLRNFSAKERAQAEELWNSIAPEPPLWIWPAPADNEGFGPALIWTRPALPGSTGQGALVQGLPPTGWEPTIECIIQHPTPHLSLEQCITDYESLFNGDQRFIRREDRQLPISSFERLFFSLWAARHHRRPKRNPDNTFEARRPNEAAAELLVKLLNLQHQPLPVPTMINTAFDDVVAGIPAPHFHVGDLRIALLRWYESCPKARQYLDTHPSGPAVMELSNRDDYRPEIRRQLDTLFRSYFADALDTVRLRIYESNAVRNQRWRNPRDSQQLLGDEEDPMVWRIRAYLVLNHENVIFADSWGRRLSPQNNAITIILDGPADHALHTAQKHFLGHRVQNIYWFWGKDGLSDSEHDITPDWYSSLAEHFVRWFPHARLFILVPPYVREDDHNWSERIKRGLLANLQDNCLNATVICDPLDLKLDDYHEQYILNGSWQSGYPPWPTDEQDAEGIPSADSLRRRKTYMREKFRIDLWDYEVGHLHSMDTNQQAAGQSEVSPDPSGSGTASPTLQTDRPSGIPLPADRDNPEAALITHLREMYPNPMALHAQTLDVSRFLNALHQLQPRVQTPTWLAVYPALSSVEALNIWGAYKHLVYSTVPPTPDSDADTDIEPEADPLDFEWDSEQGQLPVAIAAGGRGPSEQPSGSSRNPGLGHPPVAIAARGRSPPDTSSSANTRTTTSSTEPRRGTLRASSRGSTETQRYGQPRFGGGRQGQDQ